MGMQAMYHGVDAATVDSLKAAPERLEFVESELEADTAILSASVAKLWDGLHFVLTGRASSAPGEEPGSEIVVGTHTCDEDDDDEDDDFIAYSTASEVVALARYLTSLVPDAATARVVVDTGLDLPAMRAVPVYPHIWSDADRDGLITELADELAGLRDFYRTAAERNLAVVVSIY